MMLMLKAKDAIDLDDKAAPGVEIGIGTLVGGEIDARQPTPDAVNEHDAQGLTSLISQVSNQSTSQIDSLITELHEVRNYLRIEGKRIQREITQYALLNQSAMSSTKIISDRHWHRLRAIEIIINLALEPAR